MTRRASLSDPKAGRTTTEIEVEYWPSGAARQEGRARPNTFKKSKPIRPDGHLR
jgi:hypothetical protein